MTNIEKALALINTFATGDTEKAASLLAEGYIQHNLAYGMGRDAFVGSVAYLGSAREDDRQQHPRFRGRRQGVPADRVQFRRSR